MSEVTNEASVYRFLARNNEIGRQIADLEDQIAELVEEQKTNLSALAHHVNASVLNRQKEVTA